VQETFIHAYTHYGSLQNPDRLSAWLCAIARNKAIDCARRAGRTVSMEVLHHAAVSFTPESLFLRREEHAHLMEGISSLSEKNRQVVMLFYFAQKSIREISALLALPEGSVKSRLSESRKKLKKELFDLMDNERTIVENNDIFTRIQAETQRAWQAIGAHDRAAAAAICSEIMPEEIDLTALSHEQLQILSDLYNARGSAANYTDHDEALSDYTRSLEIAEASHDPLWLSGAYSFYASQLSNRGRKEEAGRYYRLSLEMARKSGDVTQLADALFWYGMHFIDEDGPAGFTEILSLKERLLTECSMTGLTAYTLALSIDRILKNGGQLSSLTAYSSAAPGIRRKNGEYFSGGEPGSGEGKQAYVPDILCRIAEVSPFLSEEMRPGFCREESTFSFSSLPVRTVVECLADDAVLDTPAGRFEGCLHIRYTNHLSEGEDKLTNLRNNGVKDLWYAPHVGLVGISFRPVSGDGWSARLKEYAVTPSADQSLVGRFLPLIPENRWEYTIYDQAGEDLSRKFAIESVFTVTGSLPLSEDRTETVTLIAHSGWCKAK